VPPATNALELAREHAQLGKGRNSSVDEVQNQGHDLDIDGVNVTRMHAFLDRIRDSSPARLTARRAKAGSPRKS
jgi:hypothetical protein